MTQEKSRFEPALSKAKAVLCHPFAPPLFLLALTLLMFGDTLFFSDRAVLSKINTDTYAAFIYWRDFGFSEMRRGHVALWNPYLFSGAPFVGNFQSALFYPINWIHILLPVDKAVNAEIAINVFLAGLWMFFWVRHKGLHSLACLAASVSWMLGAPYFLKVYAGHLAPLAAMCWIPLLLLSADLLLEGRIRRACLLGSFALAMQILAGHPQTVYNTAIALVLYLALGLSCAPRRGRVIAGMLLIGLGAAALSAVQLGAGWDVFLEGSRNDNAIPMDFVRTFALPPENFITLLVPRFFQDNSLLGYWGRDYLWEQSLFMGVGGLLLGGFAVVTKVGETRRYWLVLGILWLLACSAYTPLFEAFYHFLPGFNKFRGHAKFIVPASAFFAMLIAIGCDQLLRGAVQAKLDQQPEIRHEKHRLRFCAIVALVGAMGAIAVGVSLLYGTLPIWQEFLSFMAATKTSYTPSAQFTQPEFVRMTAQFAGAGLMGAGGLLLLWALLGFWRGRSDWAAYVMVILAIVEIFAFARSNRPTFPLTAIKSPEIAQFFAQMPKDARMLNVQGGNTPMAFRAHDIWGYDSIVLGRYIEFMAWSQNSTFSATASTDVPFTAYNPLYSMLRCRYVSVKDSTGQRFGEVPGTPLPHVLLVSKYSVATKREKIFELMKKPSFDPSHEVILESEPDIKPMPSQSSGSARVTGEGADFLVIEAKTSGPAVLLVTDSYSQGWKAWGLAGSTQQEYSVMPGNYVLRAIPLQAGTHRLRLEYCPPGFAIGKWISLAALGCYLVLLFWTLRRIYMMPPSSR